MRLAGRLGSVSLACHSPRLWPSSWARVRGLAQLGGVAGTGGAITGREEASTAPCHGRPCPGPATCPRRILYLRITEVGEDLPWFRDPAPGEGGLLFQTIPYES